MFRGTLENKELHKHSIRNLQDRSHLVQVRYWKHCDVIIHQPLDLWDIFKWINICAVIFNNLHLVVSVSEPRFNQVGEKKSLIRS